MSSSHGKRTTLSIGAVHPIAVRKNADSALPDVEKSHGPPSVVVTEFSDEESELRSITGSPVEQKPEGIKTLKAFASNGNAMSKWKVAGRQVKQQLHVTQVMQRPQTRQEKVRRQLHGAKAALPVLPVPAAICLLVINVLLPGIGTVVAGFTYICCSTTYDKPDRKGIWDKIPGLVCTNAFVGLAQLLTVSFLLIGWFWSISSGLTMVQLAKEREKEKLEDDQAATERESRYTAV